MVAQLEVTLRGLAQRVASIPGEFFERVGRLSRSEIENLVNLAPDYKPEMRRFWRIHNLLVSLGFAIDDARLMARSCISAELFSQWTLQGGRIWTTEEFEKYKDIISVLKPKTELLRKETDALLTSSQKIELVATIWQKHGLTDPSSPLSAEMLDGIVNDADKAMKALPETPETEQDIRDVNRIALAIEGWKKLASESEVAAKRLSALFAIIARNDRHTVRQLRQPNNTGAQMATGKPDPVIASLVNLLEESYAPQVWSSAVVVSSVTGAIACAILLSIYFHCVEIVETIWTGSAESTILLLISATRATINVETTSVLRDSLFTSITMLCSFALASLVSLFLRSAKIDDGEWIFFTRFRRIPLSNYYVIVLWGSLAAFMPLVISWILYYYDPGQANVGAISSEEPAAIAQRLAFRFLLGFTAVAYAIGVCIIADIVDTSAKNSRQYGNTDLCVRIVAATVFIEFVCLIVNPFYTLASKPFWSNVIAVLLFSYAALRAFLSSYEAYTKG